MWMIFSLSWNKVTFSRLQNKILTSAYRSWYLLRFKNLLAKKVLLFYPKIIVSLFVLAVRLFRPNSQAQLTILSYTDAVNAFYDIATPTNNALVLHPLFVYVSFNADLYSQHQELSTWVHLKWKGDFLPGFKRKCCLLHKSQTFSFCCWSAYSIGFLSPQRCLDGELIVADVMFFK